MEKIKTKDGRVGVQGTPEEIAQRLASLNSERRTLMHLCLDMALEALVTLQSLKTLENPDPTERARAEEMFAELGMEGPVEAIDTDKMYEEIEKKCGTSLSGASRSLLNMQLVELMIHHGGTGTCIAWEWGHMLEHCIENERGLRN